jgi:hypothetical protein
MVLSMPPQWPLGMQHPENVTGPSDRDGHEGSGVPGWFFATHAPWVTGADAPHCVPTQHATALAMGGGAQTTPPHFTAGAVQADSPPMGFPFFWASHLVTFFPWAAHAARHLSPAAVEHPHWPL